MKISILFIIVSLLSNLLFGLETKEIKLKLEDKIKLEREIVQEYKPAYAKIKFQGKIYTLTFDNNKINKKLIKEKLIKFLRHKESNPKVRLIATLSIAISVVFIAFLFMFTAHLLALLMLILVIVSLICLYPAFFPSFFLIWLKIK